MILTNSIPQLSSANAPYDRLELPNKLLFRKRKQAKLTHFDVFAGYLFFWAKDGDFSRKLQS
jgi:hypothetical protein